MKRIIHEKFKAKHVDVKIDKSYYDIDVSGYEKSKEGVGSLALDLMEPFRGWEITENNVHVMFRTLKNAIGKMGFRVSSADIVQSNEFTWYMEIWGNYDITTPIYHYPLRVVVQ